jgi:hypothetical protein
MSLFENLQQLSLDIKVLLLIVVLVWGASEVRHARRQRADQHTIRQLQAEGTQLDGTRLELRRSPEMLHGAAVTLGEVVLRGSTAGQYFVGAITNTGPHPAEDIAVTAVLGTHKTEVLTAPRRLPAHSASSALEIWLPFGFLTDVTVQDALTRGERLRVQVRFTDPRAAPQTFDQCFVFSLEPSSSASADPTWVSRRVRCA